jgi:S-(hydroxymethyl)glutathione dehydrogenase/alcohol dehydrogenase
MSKAAVHVAFDQPLEIRTDVEVADPQEGEIKVRIAASGVCHSDLSVQNATIPLPPPCVLGHEGAGVVEAVGAGVTGFEPGDHVVLTFVPQCGQCFFCTRGQGFLCEGGVRFNGGRRMRSGEQELTQMTELGTFSDVTVVPAISAVKIDRDVPLKIAALLGCGVQTGVGAATNTADIRTGDSVAVIGCGGVGLNVIQGARIAGADRIVAIDTMESKLQMAKEFGATDFVNASEVDPVTKVKELTGGRGVDVAFEVIGLAATIQQAMDMARRGGETVLVGVPRFDVNLSINANFGMIMTAKTLKGCWYGSTNASEDIPKLLDLYKKGELKLDELISREIPLEQVNEAFEAMKNGEVARSVIVFD